MGQTKKWWTMTITTWTGTATREDFQGRRTNPTIVWTRAKIRGTSPTGGWKNITAYGQDYGLHSITNNAERKVWGIETTCQPWQYSEEDFSYPFYVHHKRQQQGEHSDTKRTWRPTVYPSGLADLPCVLLFRRGGGGGGERTACMQLPRLLARDGMCSQGQSLQLGDHLNKMNACRWRPWIECIELAQKSCCRWAEDSSTPLGPYIWQQLVNMAMQWYLPFSLKIAVLTLRLET